MAVNQAILIVDDRPQNLLALEKTLADTSAELVKATSGEQALAATLQRDFALAILDVQMPGMDGYELAELIRGDPKTKYMPIIFLTAASSDKEQIFKGYEAGAVDYIVKPYSLVALLSKVRVFLELDRRKTELLASQKQLELTNQELEAFAYSVSHDLRAPLRAIEGYSQALLEDYLDCLDEKGREYLKRSSAAARRMAQLIDDLLRLSRISRSEIQTKPVDLSHLAMEVIKELRETSPKREVEVVIEESLAAIGDKRLLRQALQNLLGNAWKFTSKKPRARIEVGSIPGESGKVCFVRDNGVGFEMAYADKLFAPFQRLHSTGEFSGSGVGLSTVQRIVHRHGGTIWAESEVDKGTTFFITLPPAMEGSDHE